MGFPPLEENMPNTNRIVAIGLLTQSDLALLGSSFARLWPVDEAPCFTGLIEAIDKADRQLWDDRDAADNE
jgi:hypothetical protein